ncbi:MAG: TetR/AcrR family transcriptional regulator [bacterium]
MKNKSELIFNAAFKLFLKCGYNNTSMDEVAKEAGVSKQTIYNNFENKQIILQKIVINQSKKYYKDIEDVEVTEENFDILLEKFCKNFLKLVIDEKLCAVHRIVLSEMATNPNITKNFYNIGPSITYIMLEKFISKAAAKGLIQVSSPSKYADHLISLLKGKYYNEILFGVRDNVSKEELEEHLKSVLTILNNSKNK